MSQQPTDSRAPLVPEDLVRSTFDDLDMTNYEPVPDYDPIPDRGPITHSAFDDEDRIDDHPVP